MEPFEPEEEQRQQVDARFTINISQPINIDVEPGQVIPGDDHITVIDRATSDLQEIIQLTVDVPAYLILDKLRFALLNFMNTNIPRSEIESYFRSL